GTADAATARHFVETMHRQAKRMSALVTDLLRLAELEAQPDEGESEPVRLVDAAREAIATVSEGRPDAPGVTGEIAEDLIVAGSGRADHREPRRERRSPRWWRPDTRIGRARHWQGAHRGGRLRAGDRAGASVTDLRALLPGRARAKPYRRRHGPRPLHREAS